MLAAGAGGAVDLHLDILGADLHRLRRPAISGMTSTAAKRGLAAGVGVKGRHPHQTVDTVLTLQKAVGIFAFDGNSGGFDARLVAIPHSPESST